MPSKRLKRTPIEQAEWMAQFARIHLYRYIYSGEAADLSDAYYYTRYSARAALTVLHEHEQRAKDAS